MLLSTVLFKIEWILNIVPVFIIFNENLSIKRQKKDIHLIDCVCLFESMRQDLNLRPLRPEFTLDEYVSFFITIFESGMLNTKIKNHPVTNILLSFHQLDFASY